MSQDVQYIDHGWGRYESQMKYLDDFIIKAGLPENEQVGNATRQGSHQPFGSMDELVEIAVVNEFGTSNGHISPRPFIRSAMDLGKDEIEALKRKLYEDVVDGKITAETALKRIGIKAVSLIRNRIRDIKTPENEQSTKDRKGSSNPLIDTGQMRQSIQFVQKRKQSINTIG